MTFTFVDARSPNETDAPDWKLVPMIVTMVPPAVGPVAGASFATVGAGAVDSVVVDDVAAPDGESPLDVVVDGSFELDEESTVVVASVVVVSVVVVSLVDGGGGVESGGGETSWSVRKARGTGVASLAGFGGLGIAVAVGVVGIVDAGSGGATAFVVVDAVAGSDGGAPMLS